MFSTSDLQDLRQMVLETLTEVCTITLEGQYTAGAGGRGVYGAGDVSPVACRRIQIGGSPQERLIADRLKDEPLLVVIVPWDTVVDGAQTVSIGGTDYEVVGTLPATTYVVDRRLVVKDGS